MQTLDDSLSARAWFGCLISLCTRSLSLARPPVAFGNFRGSKMAKLCHAGSRPLYPLTASLGSF